MPATVATKQKYPPGDLAIWIFICAELLVFCIFFASYAFARANNIEMFNQAQLSLDTDLALINTLALLTSSYFVACAVVAIKKNHTKNAATFLLAAIAGGATFLVVKLMEYAHHFDVGENMSTNLFFMFYFSLTFFHFLHVILGMVILTALWVKTRKGDYSAEQHNGLESGGAYWHMVDMVWLLLFPLVYIMR